MIPSELRSRLQRLALGEPDAVRSLIGVLHCSALS